MVCVQVLEAVLERLQDFEDKVRSRSITAICEAAMASPEVRPSTNFRTCGTDIALLLPFCSVMQHSVVHFVHKTQAACSLRSDWYCMNLDAAVNQQ